MFQQISALEVKSQALAASGDWFNAQIGQSQPLRILPTHPFSTVYTALNTYET
jgi:hypothetical protein